MKKLVLIVAAFLSAALPGWTATISFVAPTAAPGAFDVVVRATNLFAGRDTLTDEIISYGFNVGFSIPGVLTFVGADSGSEFDPPSAVPGTDVFGAASGLGVFPGVAEALILATLHFNRTAPGLADILITSDLSNPFQGLQFLNEPFAESIAGTLSIADTPEPVTFGMCGIGLLVLARRRYLRRL